MQTFVPYPDIELCAKVLDYRRLGAQRREARQILRACLGLTPGWKGVGLVHAWKGYEYALTAYGNAMIREWVRRGYNNTMEILPEAASFELPPWFGGAIHSIHRGLLRYKAAQAKEERVRVWYDQFGWTDEPAPLTMQGPNWSNGRLSIKAY